MENLKIKVNNAAESKEAQELFFKLGYGWFGERKHEFNGLDARYLLTKSRGTLHYTKEYIFFALLEIKEITLQELRIMTTPQHKEYLDPHNDYELIEWDGGFMIQDHWIEVPEGAEKATLCNDFLIFWKKKKYSFSVSEGAKWCHKIDNDSIYYDFDEYLKKHDDAAVIWQRNAGKEYLDPTDNYKLTTTPSPMPHLIEVPKGAEILADTWVGLIFYKKKDCESFEFSHAGDCEWSLTPTNPYNEEGFIGALVWQRDAQPSATSADEDSADELFASISLESTLAERQASYGDFEDVAYTTESLVDVLKKANYDKMTKEQKMALYMICSKMARLANGDPAHKDSWHDIAGYAKLVEDSL